MVHEREKRAIENLAITPVMQDILPVVNLNININVEVSMQGKTANYIKTKGMIFQS